MENKSKLYQKILKTQGDINNIGKDGNNTEQRYKFAQWEDIIKEVRKAAFKNNLLINITTAKKEMSQGESRKGAKFSTCNITVRISLIDVETGLSIKHFFHGEGRDYGDKSIYKAYTGAVKYGIIEIFLVPIGDDPENSEESKNATTILHDEVKKLKQERIELKKEVLTVKCKLIPEELNKKFKSLKHDGVQAVKFIEKYKKNGDYDWIRIESELKKLVPVSKEEIQKALKSIPEDIRTYFREKKYSEKEVYKRIASMNMDWIKIRTAIKSSKEKAEGKSKNEK